jgi:outer membrane protein OmpU
MRGRRAIVASLPLVAAIGVGSVQAMDLVQVDSDNPFSLKAWLHASAVAAWVEQDDPFDVLRDHGFAFNAELEVRGGVTFDNGSQLGAFVEFELDNDNNDAVVTDNNKDILDKAYLYYKSIYGHVQFGATDGAADQMSIAAPSISRETRINGGDIYFFEVPFDEVEFRPVVLRTDLYASGDNIKVVYFTPRWKGFQAGVSYMPDFSHSLMDFFDPDTTFDQQSEMFELAANYSGSIGTVDVAVGGAYLTGNNEAPAFNFALGRDNEDIEEWTAGANVGFGIERFAVRVGGSYKHSNVSGAVIFGASGTGVVDDEFDTDIWDIGATVSRGPFSVGATYIRGESEENNFFNASGISFLDGDAFEVGAGYKFGPGIRFNLAYQHYEYENDPSGFFFNEFYNGEHSAELDTVFLEAAVDL